MSFEVSNKKWRNISFERLKQQYHHVGISIGFLPTHSDPPKKPHRWAGRLSEFATWESKKFPNALRQHVWRPWLWLAPKRPSFGKKQPKHLRNEPEKSII